jgi:hypothetical protein
MLIDVSEDHVVFIFRISYLAYSSTLKIEATYFSETSVDFGLHGVISEKIEFINSSFNFKRVRSGTYPIYRAVCLKLRCVINSRN